MIEQFSLLFVLLFFLFLFLFFFFFQLKLPFRHVLRFVFLKFICDFFPVACGSRYEEVNQFVKENEDGACPFLIIILFPHFNINIYINYFFYLI
jgi:hypothetical protein